MQSVQVADLGVHPSRPPQVGVGHVQRSTGRRAARHLLAVLVVEGDLDGAVSTCFGRYVVADRSCRKKRIISSELCVNIASRARIGVDCRRGDADVIDVETRDGVEDDGPMDSVGVVEILVVVPLPVESGRIFDRVVVPLDVTCRMNSAERQGQVRALRELPTLW